MPIVSGFVVPKMNSTSHDGNIKLLRPMVLTIKHQIDNQTKNDETNGKEKPDEILDIVYAFVMCRTYVIKYETRVCFPDPCLIFN